MTVATLRRISGDVSDIGRAEHLDGAVVGTVGPDQAAQQGGLARAVAPGQGDGLTRPHLEVEPVEDGVGPKARFSPDTLSTVVRLAMGAILPPSTS